MQEDWYARTRRPKRLERDFLQFMLFEADDPSKVLTEIFLFKRTLSNKLATKTYGKGKRK